MKLQETLLAVRSDSHTLTLLIHVVVMRTKLVKSYEYDSSVNMCHILE